MDSKPFSCIYTGYNREVNQPNDKCNLCNTVFYWQNKQLTIVPMNKDDNLLEKYKIELILRNEINYSDPELALDQENITIVLI